MVTTTKPNRILIVEDDANIRGVMSRHFRRHGFEVEQAGAAEEVLERFSTTAQPFDVVVTDVHLPGRSGVELARHIHDRRPSQPIVFMTGDSDAKIARQALQDGAPGFLLKPFEFFELDAVVNHALQRRESVTPQRLKAVVRGLGKTAHVTLPPKVVLRTSARARADFAVRARVAVATAVLLGLAWLAGTALVPAPAQAARAAYSEAPNTNNRPMVVPVVVK